MSDPAGPAYKIPVSVLVVVHTQDLQVLLLERKGQPGFWQSVTGSQEPGEDLLTTACREVMEETSIKLDSSKLKDWGLSNRYEIFQQWRHRYPPDIQHNVEHVFSACVPNDLAITPSEAEHSAARWVPLEEAAKLCFSWSNRDAIHLLKEA